MSERHSLFKWYVVDPYSFAPFPFLLLQQNWIDTCSFRLFQVLRQRQLSQQWALSLSLRKLHGWNSSLLTAPIWAQIHLATLRYQLASVLCYHTNGTLAVVPKKGQIV